MHDRAMQTLYALALEPIAEITGDHVSFGFRKGRSAKDACEEIFNILARKCTPTWILEGDLFPTETGSPQGEAISSIYANMTLDDLEKLIQNKYHRNSKEKIENHYRAKTKVNLVRYADDFIITANTKEIAEKLIVKPSKSSIKTLIRKCSTIILKEMKAGTQSELIRRLNQIIRGWTNYHMHVVASHAFSYINNTLYILLQRWAKHRQPNKNLWWRLNRYWHEKNGKRWLFMTDEYSLINLRRIQIVRHPKLQISKNPFTHKEYY